MPEILTQLGPLALPTCPRPGLSQAWDSRASCDPRHLQHNACKRSSKRTGGQPVCLGAHLRAGASPSATHLPASETGLLIICHAFAFAGDPKFRFVRMCTTSKLPTCGHCRGPKWRRTVCGRGARHSLHAEDPSYQSRSARLQNRIEMGSAKVRSGTHGDPQLTYGPAAARQHHPSGPDVECVLAT